MTLSPFIKWAGGKQKELKYIIPNFPDKFNRYLEPFVGGGAVYLSIDMVNDLYINDKSPELINLYMAIREQDKTFFDKLQEINNSWIALEDTVLKHASSFMNMYKDYSNGIINGMQLHELITEFMLNHSLEFISSLYMSFNINLNNYIKEIEKNLINKTMRMKKIEAKKGRLCEDDILDNIECAFKSAFYMHFRYLYNNINELNINKSISTAIFYFIREYCFSSMFRYNKKGEFNVPYGGISYNRKDFSKKIEYLKCDKLVSHLKNTSIFNLDFQHFFSVVAPSKGDFMFIDPPYDSDFSTYANNAFSQADHKRLAEHLYATDAYFLLIIKNTDLIHSLYYDKGFKIQAFDKKYLVSFQNRNDKDAEHLIITNY
ncbi:MAG TPA: DNA adenine methylase [Thermoanaerobacterales bacterium]|nr:DNA adenine methylase [Thermoanaerobacterales bacterium]